MADVRFDTYYRYEDLTRLLKTWAAAHPELLRLETLGDSQEGRPIWLAILTRQANGDHQDKPAFWVDGNLHAAELAGSMACLYLIHRLLTGYGHDPEITRCLQTRTIYVCPRANPDGAEWALGTPPRLVRSGTRAYPYPDAPRGLVQEDVDGDGRILTMRLPDPDGAWKISDRDPRLMVPREPAEDGGRYYRLLPEGRLTHYDGDRIPVPPAREGLDFNRNFPARWRGEHEQVGAGPYPASEPEVRALVRFLCDHPNVCGGVAFHCYSGVLLRPLSYAEDLALPPEDLHVYRLLGEQGTALTGYPAASAYHEFRYHPRQVITGACDDWLYEERGLYAWTVELWSPQRRAGIELHSYLTWYRDHTAEDDLKLLQWNDQELNGQGFVPWYSYQHPQLGAVELGGWDPLYTFWNPPPALLEEELARFPAWLVWLALLSPRLELDPPVVTALGDHAYLLRVRIRNSGWLPTYVSRLALDKKLVRDIQCELRLPDGASLLQGDPRMELGQLEGRAHKPRSAFGWAGGMSDPTDNRAHSEWLFRAPPGSLVTVTARHPRAGTATQSVRLV